MAAPEQQAEFAAAVKEAELKQAELATAQARVQAAILRAMAKLKLDPDEHEARLVEGRLVFVKKAVKK